MPEQTQRPTPTLGGTMTLDERMLRELLAQGWTERAQSGGGYRSHWRYELNDAAKGYAARPVEGGL